MNKLIPAFRFLFAVSFILFITSTAFTQQAFNMTRLSQWDSGLAYSDCWGYSNGTGEYAILGSHGFVHFIDVTDPFCPTLVDEFAPGGSSGWRDFKTYGNYVYACAQQGSEGLLIFDMAALPTTITYLGNETVDFSNAHNIYIDEQHGRLYVVGSDTQNAGMIVLDIATDPENPSLLSSVGLPGGYIHDVHVVNNIAYCSHLSNGLYIYDYSDPLNPVTLGQMTTYIGQVFNHSGWLSDDGTQFVFCDEKHGESVKIVNVSDPTDLFLTESNLFKSELLSPEFTNSIAHNPFIKDSLAYIAYYHDGLQVFNISDPDNVTRVAYYDSFENINYNGYSGVWGVYPFLPSGNILMSDRSNGLFVVEMGCQTDLALTTPTVSGLYAASDNVITTGNMVVENKTTFRAEQCVEMNPGFEVPVGVLFEANSKGCN